MSQELPKAQTKLLRQLAEAYAFISDLRESALLVGNRWVLQRTEGIENRVEVRKKEYPIIFQRYFAAAKKRVRNLINVEKPPVQRREEAPAYRKKAPPKPGPTRSGLE